MSSAIARSAGAMAGGRRSSAAVRTVGAGLGEPQLAEGIERPVDRLTIGIHEAPDLVCGLRAFRRPHVRRSAQNEVTSRSDAAPHCGVALVSVHSAAWLRAELGH